MIDVTRNAWILDKTREPENYATQVALDIEIGLAKAPVFEELSDTFWLEHFADQTSHELLATMTRLNVYSENTSKESRVAALVNYFRDLTGASR